MRYIATLPEHTDDAGEAAARFDAILCVNRTRHVVALLDVNGMSLDMLTDEHRADLVSAANTPSLRLDWYRDYVNAIAVLYR